MEITLNFSRSNILDITAFFTLVDGADTFRWTSDIPIMDSGLIQSYLSGKINEIRCGIYREQFKDAIFTQNEGETALQAWQRIEAAGEDVKYSWVDSFALADVTRHNDINMNLPSWSQVDTAITNIANLTDTKAIIRKLARVVYWLAKNTEA